MNKLTAREILNLLKRLEEIAWLYPERFAESGLDEVQREMSYIDQNNVAEVKEIIEELGEVREIVNTTEPKDYEYEIQAIHYFPKHDVYIETTGTYMSYDGTTFNNGFGKEVKPNKKVLITFEEVAE